jgi:nucleotide-binding universal stress UspA family protein
MNKQESDFQGSASPAHPWLTGKIVVGVDGSEGSQDALRHAEQLAITGGARLEAVIAWQPTLVYGPIYSVANWAPQDDALHVLDATVAAVFGDDVPESMTRTVAEGVTAQVLIEASKDADLLVVGSRGYGGFAGLLLGSVSSACAEHAKCPVLVVHPARPERAARHDD